MINFLFQVKKNKITYHDINKTAITEYTDASTNIVLAFIKAYPLGNGFGKGENGESEAVEAEIQFLIKKLLK